jgi:hypothetical protein
MEHDASVWAEERVDECSHELKFPYGTDNEQRIAFDRLSIAERLTEARRLGRLNTK